MGNGYCLDLRSAHCGGGIGTFGVSRGAAIARVGLEVVVLEMAPRSDLVENLRALDIPIIQGDALSTLEAANIRRARVIVLCTQNDNLNMQLAVKARHLTGTCTW